MYFGLCIKQMRSEPQLPVSKPNIDGFWTGRYS